MSVFTDEAAALLARAKLNYQVALGEAETKLQNAVRQDPAQLAAALSVQASYTAGLFATTALAARFQRSVWSTPRTERARASGVAWTDRVGVGATERAKARETAAGGVA